MNICQIILDQIKNHKYDLKSDIFLIDNVLLHPYGALSNIQNLFFDNNSFQELLATVTYIELESHLSDTILQGISLRNCKLLQQTKARMLRYNCKDLVEPPNAYTQMQSRNNHRICKKIKHDNHTICKKIKHDTILTRHNVNQEIVSDKFILNTPVSNYHSNKLLKNNNQDKENSSPSL